MYLFAPFILQNFKKILVLNNFFGINHYYLFHLPIGLFHYAKFLKILTVDQELWGCAIFGPKMVHLPQTKIFQKIINIVLIYLLALFRKPVNEPCFFHLCLSTCQKSKSDINLLVKYWRLKNTEISLAESHFWL